MDFMLGEILGAILCMSLIAPIGIAVWISFRKIDVDHDGKSDI